MQIRNPGLRELRRQAKAGCEAMLTTGLEHFGVSKQIGIGFSSRRAAHALFQIFFQAVTKTPRKRALPAVSTAAFIHIYSSICPHDFLTPI
ncbi:MAG: hypothetical protein Q8K18_11710 [Burkholderiales bacterium]|nr:hypothetical protein [Burkholderiales bacterium]